jgi:acyl-CoA thioesterase FadM
MDRPQHSSTVRRILTMLHRIERIVAFHDTDPAGVAHFTAALRWMEECEHEFLRACGLPVMQERDGARLGWPRVAVRCAYRAPLRCGDAVQIELDRATCTARSLEWCFILRRGETVVAEGGLTVVHAALAADAAIRVLELPAELLARLTAAEGS